MIVGIYCRVSTDLQEDRNESIPDQKRLGKEFAESKGWEYEFYVDVQSGKDPTREGFNRLRRDSLNGHIHAIWIKNHYRLARRASTALSLVEDLEEQHKAGNHIPFYILNREFDYDDANEKMIFTMWSAIAESERSQIVERTSRGRNTKYLNGGMHVRRLYGYYRNYDAQTGKTQYCIDEREAEIVREIINRIIRGESYRSVARDLTKRRITTPEGGSQWSGETISRIAKQKLYTGYYDYHDKVNIASYLYKPIIEWETHIQAKTATNRAIERRKGSTDTTRHNHYLATGVVTCWYCRGKAIFNREKKVINGKSYSYAYYKLVHKRDCSRTYKRQSTLREDTDAWLMLKAIGFLLDRETMFSLYEEQRKEVARQEGKYTDKIETLEKDIAKIRKRKNKLMALDLDDEDVITQIKTLSQQQRALERDKKELEMLMASQDEKLEQLLTELVKSSLVDFFSATTYKRRTLLLSWIKTCYVKDHDITIEWITGKTDTLQSYRDFFKTKLWKEMCVILQEDVIDRVTAELTEIAKLSEGEYDSRVKKLEEELHKDLLNIVSDRV